MDKNHPFVKQQIKEAQYKALIWGALITLFLMPFYFSVLGFIGVGVIFMLSRGATFTWFARKVIKFVEPCEPVMDDPAMEELNVANGNFASPDFVLPNPLSHND